MVDPQARNERLPSWAALARRTFRGLVVFWAVVYLVGGTVWVSSMIFNFDRPDIPLYPSVAFGALISIAALAGVLWLIGEGIAGFKDDKPG